MRIVLAAWLAAAAGARAQGTKPLLEWLKEYSPTGYHIITDFETKADKPGDHLQWTQGQTLPLGAVAVHECGHMRNLTVYSKNSTKSYYIGDKRDYAFVPGFKPFSSAEIIPDVPAALRNFQFEVYIQGGEGMYSVGSGIIGIMEEWNQYITGLKSGVEMAACFKANFNGNAAWADLTNDVTTSVWSNAEFRYFCLRYILKAKTAHADVYAKILADAGFRQGYSHLVAFAEKTMEEWIAVLKEKNLNTTTQNGFDWHWKYWNEIQKAEYKELEKLLLITPVSIAPPHPASHRISGNFLPGAYDLRGRRLPSRSQIPVFRVQR